MTFSFPTKYIRLLTFWAILVVGCREKGNGPTTDSGPQFIGMGDKLVTKLVYAKPYLYAGAAAKGVWRRDLSKMTDWEYLGLADTSLGGYSNVGVLDVDVCGSDILVAYNGSAPSVDPKSTVGIWHSTDGGSNWFRSDSGIPESITDPYEYNDISACQRSPDRPEIEIARLAVSTYRSTNGGYNWELISGRRGVMVGDDYLRWNPFQPGEVWAFGSTAIFAPYMEALTEYGLSKRVDIDFNSLGFPSDGSVSDVAFDCGDPSIIYAAAYGELIKSTDGGSTWVVGRTVTPDSGGVFTLIEHRSKPGVLFLAGEYSIYYSVDHGETIHMLATVPVSFIASLAIDEEQRRLFIGSSRGVCIVSFPSVVN